MDKRTDIAMIGDRDSVLIGKAVGLGVFDETDGERANRLIYRLARDGCKVISDKAGIRLVRQTIKQIQDGDIPRNNTHSGFPRPFRRGHGSHKGQRGKGYRRGYTILGG